MPPHSRGSAAARTTATTATSPPAQHAHDERREQQRRLRAHNASLRMQDPLTLLITLVTYPLLIVALSLLHIGYYVVLKARASARLSRAAASLQQRVHRGKQRYFLPVARQRSGLYEVLCDNDAQARLFTRSLQRHQKPPCKCSADNTDESANTSVIPSHVALALGVKPVRTRSLLCRLAMLPFRRQAAQRVTPQNKPDAEQERFAMLSMRSIVRCCAFAGIETLTVYDEGGYLASAFRNSHKEVVRDKIFIEGVHANSEHGKGEFEDSKEDSTACISLCIEATIILPFKQQTKGSSCHTNLNGGGACREFDGTADRRMRIHVLGPDDSANALARTASWIAAQRKTSRGTKTTALKLSPQQLTDVLHAHDYPSDPDLLLIHGGARQISTLHGFPPWLLRLCEIYHDIDAAPYAPLSPSSFERALHAYSRSEQRYGK